MQEPNREERDNNPNQNRAESQQQLPHHQQRLTAAKEILAVKGVRNAILFDDIDNAVDEHQRDLISGFAGYMRCCVPATDYAVHVPTHVLSLTPPLPHEVYFARELVATQGGDPNNLHVWTVDNSTGELVDLTELLSSRDGVTRYEDLIVSTAQNPPTYSGDEYVTMVRELKSLGEATGKSLVVPFQTKWCHYQQFQAEIAQEELALSSPADPYVNKVQAAAKLLQEDKGLAGHFTTPIAVQIERAPVTNDEELDTLARAIRQSMTEDDLRLGALRVDLGDLGFFSFDKEKHRDVFSISEAASLTAIRRMLREYISLRVIASRLIGAANTKEVGGVQAYIKLDASGVSGVDNLNPDTYPGVYAGGWDHRVATLTQILVEKFAGKDKLPVAAVEDRVEKSRDRFGVREFCVSGLHTGSDYSFVGVQRSINVDDVYQGILASTDPTRIGISKEEFRKLRALAERVGEAQTRSGYQVGYAGKDVMIDERDGEMRINDHNDRRGGRSFIERIAALHPGKVFMDRDFEFLVPKEQSAIEYAMELVDNARQCGMQVYGTPLIYYPETTPEGQKLKLKIVTEVPEEILQSAECVVAAMDRYVRDRARGIRGRNG